MRLFLRGTGAAVTEDAKREEKGGREEGKTARAGATRGSGVGERNKCEREGRRHMHNSQGRHNPTPGQHCVINEGQGRALLPCQAPVAPRPRGRPPRRGGGARAARAPLGLGSPLACWRRCAVSRGWPARMAHAPPPPPPPTPPAMKSSAAGEGAAIGSGQEGRRESGGLGEKEHTPPIHHREGVCGGCVPTRALALSPSPLSSLMHGTRALHTIAMPSFLHNTAHSDTHAVVPPRNAPGRRRTGRARRPRVRSFPYPPPKLSLPRRPKGAEAHTLTHTHHKKGAAREKKGRRARSQRPACP